MAPIDLPRWRAVANWLNLATPCGLLVARASGCRVVDGGQGLHFALGYGRRLPAAAAFTVGNVVLFRGDADPWGSPGLVDHEARHCTQYALCLGLPFLPLYALAAGYSWLRTGDPASRNAFERRAGLADGGYRERPPRPLPRVLARVRPRSRPRS